MNIKEDYVSFEVAKLLEEAGFTKVHCQNSPHYSYNADGQFSGPSWDSVYLAPTLQMAIKWLEKEKHIAIIPVLSSILDNEKFLWDVKIVIAETGEKYSQGWVYEDKESAYDAAIKYCLENLI